MKKFCLFVAILPLAFSCNTEELEKVKQQVEASKPVLTQLQAQEAFSRILSKAVYSNESLRRFLKKEALLKFDRDYDIFYPLCKNKEISEGITLREALLQECESNESFEQIEASLPLLDILVPDWSYMGENAFSASRWDTSDPEVAVAFELDCGGRTLYGDGKIIGRLESNEYPAFPALIVKNNERMKVTSPATRGSDQCYDFVDEAFDGNSEQTRGWITWRNYDINLDAPIADEYLPEEELKAISPQTLEAYKQFKNFDDALQRDYIYYGLTRTKTEGKLKENLHLQEMMYKIKLRSNNSSLLTDGTQENPTGKDPVFLHSTDDEYWNKGGEYSHEELADPGRFNWVDGSLDFYFYVMYAKKGANGDAVSISAPKYLSFDFDELFNLNKVHVKYRHTTALVWRSKRIYNVDVDCYEPKWLTVRQPLLQTPWNLTETSAVVQMKIVEFDGEEKITKKEEVTAMWANNFKADGDFSGGGDSLKADIKVGYGISNSETTKYSVNVEYISGSDDFGTLSFMYTNPIIDGERTVDGKKQYKMRICQAGEFQAMILPVQ